ncbi:peptidoglycan DD-metalloendopeptidase family protein [Brevundimonas sp. NIBR11]|uniref:murein hydrolase activator EnvC family protein n=1 Tax=Brevundimonas sp. NIBR11 TaxID=3015999 RepID=UPI0022F13546|nr:peptidoglycan DD-metalloendopeptidase family protein [Brevundimonas sp. NIBR11]WGM32849.1 hypothetical protein KKHFBJBL_03104 [Brevundimonas sp. NIBR11]
MNRAAATAVLIALAALPASASVQDDLSSLQAQYRDEQVRARRLRADARDAQAEITALDRELATLRTDQSADDMQIASQRQRLRELSQREAAIIAELARARDGQGRLLSALQMMSRKPPPPLLIPADEAVDTVRAAILMKAMAPEMQRRAATFADRQAEVVRIRRLAVLSSERLLTTESAQGDRRAEIEDLTTRRTALLTVLRADAARAERAAAALETRIRNLGGRPASAADAPTPATRLPGGRARLTAPVGGAATKSGQGVLWAAPAGPVASPAGARVDHAGPLSGWGEVIILDLGGGWRAVVAGLDAVTVETGQRVADGQALGSAERGGEVYFELRRDERAVDPTPYL